MNPGTRLGPYEITAKLGEGGMGEVYRATDLNLRREVAIKVLPAEFTADPERLARFEREAQLLAQLHHPNIASIFGLERSDSVRALVMEFVDGPTLAERLERGPLPLDECLDIAAQIALALEAAHEKAIVHRDLKPQNVKLSLDDKVKVLDFGLAKATDPAASGAGDAAASQLARSPTLTLGATQLGVILGTAAYMSPEQAKGAAVDKRADIWAFGVVLYEMLTGHRLFAGDSITDTLAAVLRQEVDWSLLPPETPPSVRHLLERCLARDRKQRLHDVGDARLELEDVLAGRVGAAALAVEPARRPSRFWPLAGAAGLAVGALGLVVGLTARTRVAKPEPFVLSVSLPDDVSLEPSGDLGGPVIVSPSGRAIAFCARRGRGAAQVWVRRLDEAEVRPIPGTEGAGHPFWSPDEKSLGFFSALHLRTVGVAGGPVTTLAAAPGPRGGTWSAVGGILFTPAYVGPVFRVAPEGGEPAAVTRLDEAHGEDTNRYPFFLPDGRHFLFLGRVGWKSSIYVGTLGSFERKLLLPDSANAAYGGGHLLFARGGSLLAQPLDLSGFTLRGAPRPLVEQLLLDERYAIGAFSVSPTGVLAYQTGKEIRQSRLAWVDRSDGRRTAVGDPFPSPGNDCPPALSRDERLALVCRTNDEGTSTQVWQLDLERGTKRPLSSGSQDAASPIWSPDGSTAYFGTLQLPGASKAQLVARKAGRDAEVLYEDPTAAALLAASISPDGRFLIVERWAAGEPQQLRLLDLRDPSETKQLFSGEKSYIRGQISPDGNWLAYASDETGRLEAYVAHFPSLAGAARVSLDGGDRPRWRRDGGELYFVDDENFVVGVELLKEASGELSVGRQTKLFQTDGYFDVTSDGRRFLVEEPVQGEGMSPITIRTGWENATGGGGR